jgi:DNA-binding GntR family transcriptional regulator
VTGRPGGLTEQTADLIAARLAGKPPWTPVDSDAALAAELDVSAFTVWKAKQILASRGLIVKENNAWYISPPPDEAPRGDTPASAGLPTNS